MIDISQTHAIGLNKWVIFLPEFILQTSIPVVKGVSPIPLGFIVGNSGILATEVVDSWFLNSKAITQRNSVVY